MNYEKLKKHIFLQISLIDKKINEARINLDKLPKPEEINLREHNIKKEVEKSKITENSIPFLKKVLLLNKKKLRKIIYQGKKQKIINEIKRLTSIKESLTQVLDSISEKGFIKAFTIDFYFFTEYINFFIENNIDPKNFINSLIQIFKLNAAKIDNNNNVDTELSIQRDIEKYFDNNLELINTEDINGLEFLLNKFFSLYNLNDDFLITLYISAVNKHIEYLSTKSESKKENLIIQQIILLDIIQYLKGQKKFSSKEVDVIYKTIELDENQKQELQRKINNKKEEITSQEENAKIIDILCPYLTEKDIKFLIKLKTNLPKSKNKKISLLLKRELDDIISLSKYLNMTSELNDTIELTNVLYSKIDILKELTKTTTKEPKTSNPIFYYLTDNNNIPLVVSDIKKIDITLYKEILNLIYQISLGSTDFNATKEIENILFAIKTSDNIEIQLAKSSTKIVLLKILSKKSKNKIEITTDMLEKTKKILSSDFNPETKQLFELCDILLVKNLDLNQETEAKKLLNKYC